jgi:hypothetical protein
VLAFLFGDHDVDQNKLLLITRLGEFDNESVLTVVRNFQFLTVLVAFLQAFLALTGTATMAIQNPPIIRTACAITECVEDNCS